MSEAKITIIGFHKYMQTVNDDLFKYLNLPDGIDKQDVVDNIMFRGGEFEVLYSDPYFMQDSIKVWSNKWYRTFDKWRKALDIEYDPLDNYNRFEDWTDKHSGTGSINTKTELDIALFNLTEQITDVFLREYVIPIY